MKEAGRLRAAESKGEKRFRPQKGEGVSGVAGRLGSDYYTGGSPKGVTLSLLGGGRCWPRELVGILVLPQHG